MLKILSAMIVVMNIFAANVCAVSARSAVLIDKASGRILYEKNACEKLPMASTTKIMTALIACESGKTEETVKTSAFASGTEGSSLWLKVGEEQKMENLLYGLMLKSGNDAAVALAEHLGGSVEAFSLIMNERAKEIGALNTNFVNPHGLDAEGHFTTAYDLALIAREAMKNKDFKKIVSTKTYAIPMEGELWDRALKNHNKMLWLYDGCNGVKTGFTKKCGRCLVTSAAREGKELICVTLNAPSDWSDHKELLDYGFENYEKKVLFKKGEKVKKYVYDKKYGKKVWLVSDENISVLVKKGEKTSIKKEYKKLDLPAKKGTVCGEMRVLCGEEEIMRVPLVTKNSVDKTKLLEKLNIKARRILRLA